MADNWDEGSNAALIHNIRLALKMETICPSLIFR
jgi:hypothetical protein